MAVRGRRDEIHPALAERSLGLRGWTYIFAACGLLLGFTSMAVRDWLDVSGVNTADAQPPRPGEQDASARPGVQNSVSRQAADWGVRTCLGQVALVSDFLIANRDYTALAQRGAQSADKGAFAATIAARDNGGRDSISTFVSAPLAEGECQSAYQTVAAFQQSCREVHDIHFPGFAQRVEFGAWTEAWQNGEGSYLYLLPIGTVACAVVKTQMIR